MVDPVAGGDEGGAVGVGVEAGVGVGVAVGAGVDAGVGGGVGVGVGGGVGVATGWIEAPRMVRPFTLAERTPVTTRT